MGDRRKGFPDYVNILLLGERGIGKSTLINSLANYARFNTLEDAERSSDFECLIRTSVIGSTADGEPKILESMCFNRTVREVAGFQTEEVTSYDIVYKGKIMRLIDTPGITSTKNEDYASCTKILNVIPTLQKIHGVCVLIKPDLARITSDFMYSLQMYITKLGRPVVGNIIFLFTRTRKSNYMALDTIISLRPTLEEIASKQGLVIPLRSRKSERKNCFCFENECFNYLVARAQNVKVNTSRICLEESWDVSKKSMIALLNYITGDLNHLPLEPYILPDLQKIQAASMLIFELMTPLIHLAELMLTNIDLHQMNLQRLGEESRRKHQVDETLVPLVQDITGTPLKTTVATCVNCRTDCPFQDIQDDQTDPCDSNVRIRDSCQSCYCESSIHLMRYYDIKKVETSSRIVASYEDYVDEYHQIFDVLANFADYFSHHAAWRIKDVYEQYLQEKIKFEKAAGDKPDRLRRYSTLLAAYKQSKTIVRPFHFSPDDIISFVENVKRKKYCGLKIAELHNLRHTGQQEQQNVPMEIDQKSDISPFDIQEPLFGKIQNKQTALADSDQDENDKKREAIIQLLKEKKDEEAMTELLSLVNIEDDHISTGTKNTGKSKKHTSSNLDTNIFEPQSHNRSVSSVHNIGLAKKGEYTSLYHKGTNYLFGSSTYGIESLTTCNTSRVYPDLSREQQTITAGKSTPKASTLSKVHESSKTSSNKSDRGATTSKQGQSGHSQIKSDRSKKQENKKGWAIKPFTFGKK